MEFARKLMFAVSGVHVDGAINCAPVVALVKDGVIPEDNPDAESTITDWWKVQSAACVQ